MSRGAAALQWSLLLLALGLLVLGICNHLSIKGVSMTNRTVCALRGALAVGVLGHQPVPDQQQIKVPAAVSECTQAHKPTNKS